jgi:hypothetical protein
LLNGKSNLVALIEIFKSAGVNRRMVCKNIGAVFLLVKTKPFFVVKPLKNSLINDSILLS